MTWPEVSLGEVCEFKYGKSLPAKSRVAGRAMVYGSNGQVGSHTASVSDGPTIVIGRKGSFGEVHMSADSCWPIDTTYYVDSSATDADLRWLYYRLGALGLTSLNRAAAVPGLNRDDAYRQKLLLPPLPEQRRIAAILDHADTLRTKRLEAAAVFAQLTGSLFRERFGDPRSNPKEYPVAALKTLVRQGDKINYGVVQPGGIVEGGVRLIRAGDLEGGEIDRAALRTISDEVDERHKRSRLRGDELLISCVGSIGTVAPASPAVAGYNIARAVARVPLGPLVDREYVAAWLRTEAVQDYFRAELRTVAQPTLNIKQIELLDVILPPLKEQRAFATELSKLSAIRASISSGCVGLDTLFPSLQSRAFRGEL